MILLDKNGMTEEEFLQAYARKNYPRPYLTADVAAFGEDETGLSLLLVKRGQHPFLGRWALPGGFARQSESLEESALRELEEETGVTRVNLVPVGIFSRPGRDPRGWVVSQAYAARFPMAAVTVRPGDDAADARWFRVLADRETGGLRLVSGALELRIPPDRETGCPDLAFDHGQILLQALETRLFDHRQPPAPPPEHP